LDSLSLPPDFFVFSLSSLCTAVQQGPENKHSKVY